MPNGPKLREKIALSKDIPEKLVTVPEWNCEVLLRGLTAGQRGEWNVYVGKNATGDNYDFTAVILIPYLIQTLFDPESGEAIFQDTEEDKAILAGKNLPVLTRLFNEGAGLSGLGLAAKEEIKETF